MAVTYSTTLKTNRMQLVTDVISGKTFTASGGSAAAGYLYIGTSALSGATGVLVAIPLNATAGTVSGAVLTFSGTPLSATASAGSPSTAALAEFRQSNTTTVVVSGLTVGTSGADINLNSTSITSGQTVTITSGTITHG